MNGIGPQCNSDGPFRRAMRLHQSKWRASQNLAIGNDARDIPYGNYLTEPDAKAGRNFLSPEIYQLAEKRISQGAGVEPFRCLHNLLSSQPMAFNLFGPLCQDKVLAQYLLDPLLPGGASEARVTMEWAPAPRQAYLDDASSFDVVIHYTTKAGDSAIAGIEVKLTEPFSPKRYGNNDRHTNRYLKVSSDPAIWTTPGEPALSNSTWNQIWRTHLLAQSIRQAKDVTISTAVILHHSGDEKCGGAVKAYQKNLTPLGLGTLLHWTIGGLTARWKQLLSARPEAEWLDRFSERYPDPL